MPEVIWDKEGNITNLEELTPEEVAGAYGQKNREVFDRAISAEAKEKQAREETDQLKKDLEAEKVKFNPKEKEEIENVKGTVAQLALAEKKRQFGYEHGLSPEETDKVFQLTGNNPTKEVLDDPFVKGGIETLRAKKKLAENTPSPSVKSSLGGKEFQKLEKDEKQVKFEEHMADRLRR